jgi:hypothetical protein
MNSHEKNELLETYASFGMIILKRGLCEHWYILSNSVPDPHGSALGWLFLLLNRICIGNKNTDLESRNHEIGKMKNQTLYFY